MIVSKPIKNLSREIKKSIASLYFSPRGREGKRDVRIIENEFEIYDS